MPCQHGSLVSLHCLVSLPALFCAHYQRLLFKCFLWQTSTSTNKTNKAGGTCHKSVYLCQLSICLIRCVYLLLQESQKPTLEPWVSQTKWPEKRERLVNVNEPSQEASVGKTQWSVTKGWVKKSSQAPWVGKTKCSVKIGE